MRPTAKQAALGAAVTVLALGLTGGAAALPVSPAAPAHDARRSGAPASATLTDAALDLAVRSGTYQADQRLLFQAELRLTQQCMARRGFDYPIKADGPSINDDDWRPNIEARRARGYGLSKPDPPAEEQYFRDLPAARQATYEHALFGEATQRAAHTLPSGRKLTFPGSGCIAHSRSALFGSVVDAARAFYVPQEVYLTLYRRIADDPAMHEATGRWTVCMNARGYPYASPAAARHAIADAHATAGLSDATRKLELQVALADGECALASGAPVVVNRLGRRYALQLPVSERRELNAVATLRAAALRQAAEVIH